MTHFHPLPDREPTAATLRNNMPQIVPSTAGVTSSSSRQSCSSACSRPAGFVEPLIPRVRRERDLPALKGCRAAPRLVQSSRAGPSVWIVEAIATGSAVAAPAFDRGFEREIERRVHLPGLFGRGTDERSGSSALQRLKRISITSPSATRFGIVQRRMGYNTRHSLTLYLNPEPPSVIHHLPSAAIQTEVSMDTVTFLRQQIRPLTNSQRHDGR